MALNSTDYHNLRFGRSTEESAAPTTPAPSEELIELRKQHAVLAEQVRKTNDQLVSQQDKFLKMADESNKKQEILRQEILGQVRRTEQPASSTQQQQEAAPSTWADLLTLNMAEAEQEREQTQVAQGNGQQGKYMTEDEMEAWAAKRDARLAQQRQEAAEQITKQVQTAQQLYRTEHKDIADDERADAFFQKTANEIHQINPSLPVEAIYNAAINKTRETMALFGAPAQKRQQALPNDPYNMPSQGQGAPPARRGNDPFAGYVDSSTQEDALAIRKKEQDAIRKAHLSKFNNYIR